MRRAVRLAAGRCRAAAFPHSGAQHAGARLSAWPFRRSALARTLSSNRRLRSSISMLASRSRRFSLEPRTSAKNSPADSMMPTSGSRFQAPSPKLQFTGPKCITSAKRRRLRRPRRGRIRRRAAFPELRGAVPRLNGFLASHQLVAAGKAISAKFTLRRQKPDDTSPVSSRLSCSDRRPAAVCGEQRHDPTSEWQCDFFHARQRRQPN